MNDQAVTTIDSLAIANAVARECASQPELFDGEAFSPQELEIVRTARSGRYTGAYTGRHETKVAVVVALRQQGCSLREIERRTGMDSRLVSVVLREAEKRSEIPALREVVLRRVSETAERALDRLDQELERPHPDAQLVRSLGVVATVVADKLSAAPQAAGELHLHQHVHLEGTDPTRDYLRQRAAALSTDSHAAGGDRKPLDGRAPTDPSAVMAAGSAPAVDVEAVEIGPGQAASDLAPGAAAEGPRPAANRGRGGRGGAPDHTDPMASPSETF